MPLNLSPTQSRYLANALIFLALLLSIIRIYYFGQSLWSAYSKNIVTAPMPIKQPPQVNISYDLFGVYLAKLGDDLPQSQMNVNIIGLFYSTDPKKSHVILSVDGAAEKVYAKGDTISDGVRLHRIHQNGIVLKRNEQLESISFKNESLQFGSPPAGMPMNEKE